MRKILLIAALLCLILGVVRAGYTPMVLLLVGLVLLFAYLALLVHQDG
jgi:hypothetical protein